MPQNYAAWPTFTQVIEQLTAAGIPLRVGTANAYYTQIVDGVVAELERKTHRQFIADITDRTVKYAGSGQGEQLVDDMISLTSVFVSGWIGIASFEITAAVLLSQATYPKNKIIMAEGPPYQFVHGIFTRFPEGRANIQVTGKFGYDTYIPDEVWLAVRSMASAKMAAHFIADSTSGRILKSFIEGSSSEKYVEKEGSVIGEAQGWIQEYRRVLEEFKRPIADTMKNKRRVMI